MWKIYTALLCWLSERREAPRIRSSSRFGCIMSGYSSTIGNMAFKMEDVEVAFLVVIN